MSQGTFSYKVAPRPCWGSLGPHSGLSCSCDRGAGGGRWAGVCQCPSVGTGSSTSPEAEGAGGPQVASCSHTQASSSLRQEASFHLPEPSIITQSSPWSPLLGSPRFQLLGGRGLGQRMAAPPGPWQVPLSLPPRPPPSSSLLVPGSPFWVCDCLLPLSPLGLALSLGWPSTLGLGILLEALPGRPHLRTCPPRPPLTCSPGGSRPSR